MMPSHFFWGYLRLDYESAIKSTIEKQAYSSVPRYWYVDATFRCHRCVQLFCFSAAEQKAWYEDYRIYVDSYPKHCRECRQTLRDLKTLRQEYDREITEVLAEDDLAKKRRIASVIDQLLEAQEVLQDKVRENRRCLARQIVRLERLAGE